jgi:hypothetical protein
MNAVAELPPRRSIARKRSSFPAPELNLMIAAFV